VLVALTALGGASGCSSSSPGAASKGDGQAPVCPATPDDAVGKACSVEGLACGPQYVCGFASASLSCVCKGGAFQCSDGLGNPVDPAGDIHPCPVSTGGGPACPASEAAANLAPCTTSGQICAYPSACPGALDQCYCFPGETAAGGFGKVFVCNPAICTGDASAPPILEAGTDASVTVDAAPDAPTDAPPGSVDAANEARD
jgi:hypothetical protein